ncbi:hypothetical protein SOVF_191920 [Spinacia oleracea]|nr:hypothetical protein SOVF_191920 [Spinacia oleracea]
MSALRKSLQISSSLLQSSTTQKSFSSSSNSLTSILLSKLETLLPSQKPPISQEPISKTSISNEFLPSDALKTANFPIPISQNHQNHQNSTPLSQSDVVNSLLSFKNQPKSALKYFNEAVKQPGFNVGVESLCVLVHIFAGSNKYEPKKNKNVRELFSIQQCPKDAAIVIQGLMETAERFEFRVKPQTFDILLNGFVTAGRLDDAIVCFNAMVENFGTDLNESFANFLLRILVKRDRIKEVEELLNKIVSIEITRNANIINRLLKYCVSNMKFEEADQLFRKVREMGFKLDAQTYSYVAEIVSKKPESNSTREMLLKEMRGKGLLPSSSHFKNVIFGYVQQKNMVEAIRVKDEMVSSGEPMNLAVLTRLVKGYCESGDLQNAVNLLKKCIDDGLLPDRRSLSVLIKEYCNKGNMDLAIELYNLMIVMGIKPSVYITFLLIKGFLDVQSYEKACEQLNIGVESGVIDYFSYNFLMSWLCVEGKVDEAQQLWDKIVKTGSIPTVISDEYFGYSKVKKKVDLSVVVGKDFKPNAITYTTLIHGYFKKGEVEKALKLFDEMVNQKIDCKPYTYNTIIHGLCNNSKTSEARKMLEKFTSFKPSVTTYNFIIDGFVKEDQMDCASSIHTEMSEKGVSRVPMLRKDIVEKLCENNNLDHALQVIKEMLEKGFEMDVSGFEILIGCFCSRGNIRTALNLYSQVLNTGLVPTQCILDCMIRCFRVREGQIDVNAEAVVPRNKRNKKKKKLKKKLKISDFGTKTA